MCKFVRNSSNLGLNVHKVDNISKNINKRV
jgi:hypothetical protein